MMFRGDPNFSYKPGEWRRGDIEITGSKIKTSSPFNIDRDMEKLITIINDPKEDLIRKIATTHCMFEQIHPFPDGNGRVGRILLNFILVGNGLPNIAIKGSDRNREIYISALEEADSIVSSILSGKNKTEDLKPLVKLEDLISKGLAVAIDLIICNRYSLIKPLMHLEEISETMNKPLQSIRVACSHKKHICANIDGIIKTHPDLFSKPN